MRKRRAVRRRRPLVEQCSGREIKAATLNPGGSIFERIAFDMALHGFLGQAKHDAACKLQAEISEAVAEVLKRHGLSIDREGGNE